MDVGDFFIKRDRSGYEYLCHNGKYLYLVQKGFNSIYLKEFVPVTEEQKQLTEKIIFDFISEKQIKDVVFLDDLKLEDNILTYKEDIIATIDPENGVKFNDLVYTSDFPIILTYLNKMIKVNGINFHHSLI